MKYVSCRNNFDSQDEFSPTGNSSYFGSLIPDSNELVQVHGYNTECRNVEDAYRSNKELAKETGIVNPVSGFLWPGLGRNWLESLEFHRAQSMADRSAEFLASYLNAGRAGETYAHCVMTHSLGARVALESMLHYDVKVRTLVLLGAAIGENELTTKYRSIRNNVGKILVFWSKRDNVLGRAFQLDQLKTALGHSGPSDKADWIEDFDVSKDVALHGDYRFVRSIWTTVKDRLV